VQERYRHLIITFITNPHRLELWFRRLRIRRVLESLPLKQSLKVVELRDILYVLVL
jgi:hypothetical protein